MDKSSPNERVFLSAEWRDLVMLNYEVDPVLLQRYVPRGTELDSFGGKTLSASSDSGSFAQALRQSANSISCQFRRGKSAASAFVTAPPQWRPPRLSYSFARLCQSRRSRTSPASLTGKNMTAFQNAHNISTSAGRKAAEYEWRLGREWCKLRAKAR